MLQQWRKPVTLSLTPESIAINSGDKVIRVIELQDTSSWSQVLTELEKNVANIGSRKVRFILSNNYVRYAVLPWQSDIYSQQDWQSLAENHLRSIYGNVVDSWKVSVAMQGYGKPLIVSAIDHGLLARLEEISKQFKWQIESIEPALMTVFNHYSNKFKSNDYLVMIEPQRVLLAEMGKKCIASFSLVCPVDGEEETESNKLISRSLLLKNNKLKSKLYVFNNGGLQLNIESKNITIGSLGVDNNPMSLMLAELK